MPTQTARKPAPADKSIAELERKAGEAAALIEAARQREPAADFVPARISGELSVAALTTPSI